MNHISQAMEQSFFCTSQELLSLDFALHSDWRVRYAAAVAIGARRIANALPVLEQMLAIEMQRPLYTQPKTKYIGVEGDTSLAEQVKPFTVEFPYAVDAETQEAWKCRGRVKQAICFAIYDLGQVTDSLIHSLQQMVMNENEDAPVRAAAVRAMGKVGDSRCLSACLYATTIDEWCTRVEAEKALGGLQK